MSELRRTKSLTRERAHKDLPKYIPVNIEPEDIDFKNQNVLLEEVWMKGFDPSRYCGLYQEDLYYPVPDRRRRAQDGYFEPSKVTLPPVSPLNWLDATNKYPETEETALFILSTRYAHIYGALWFKAILPTLAANVSCYIGWQSGSSYNIVSLVLSGATAFLKAASMDKAKLESTVSSDFAASLEATYDSAMCEYLLIWKKNLCIFYKLSGGVFIELARLNAPYVPKTGMRFFIENASSTEKPMKIGGFVITQYRQDSDKIVDGSKDFTSPDAYAAASDVDLDVRDYKRVTIHLKNTSGANALKYVVYGYAQYTGTLNTILTAEAILALGTQIDLNYVTNPYSRILLRCKNNVPGSNCTVETEWCASEE